MANSFFIIGAPKPDTPFLSVGLQPYEAPPDADFTTYIATWPGSKVYEEKDYRDNTVVCIPANYPYTCAPCLFGPHLIFSRFLLCLRVGNELRGFHCEECAALYGEWWRDKQDIWKASYHAAWYNLDGPLAATNPPIYN